MATPTPIFDGLARVGNGFSSTSITPWRGWSHSNNGFVRAYTAGQSSATGNPANAYARIRLETNDNRVASDYYVNTFDTPDTLTTRSQLESPRDVTRNGVLEKMYYFNSDRYIVMQFVHNFPRLSTTSGTPSPYDPNAVPFAGFATTYGPPYGGSSGNGIGVENDPDGVNVRIKDRDGWVRTLPPMSLITMIMRRKYSSAVNVADGWDMIWFGIDGNVPVATTFPNGTTRSNTWANIRSGVNDGPEGNEIHMTNYHRAYMPTWDGVHWVEFTHFKVYAAVDVTTVSDIFPQNVTSPPPPPASSATVTYTWIGAVTPTGATVSTKFGNLTGGERAQLVASTSSALTSPITGTSVTVDANGYAKLPTGALSSNTTYFYGVSINGGTATQIGSFKTYPTVSTTPTSFTFGFASCANADTAALPNLKAKNPAFFMHMGDLGYFDINTNDQTAFRSGIDGVINRTNHKPFFKDVPVHYVWSDHDWNTNDSNGSAASGPAAQAVYRQIVPHYPLGSTDGRGIYYTFVYGRVRFIVTDLRSYKSAQSATDNASKTMMGATQKGWFKNWITTATEQAIAWVCELPWIQATTAGEDQWGGYNTERQELASYISASGKNLVIISGDMHALAYDSGVNSPGGIPVFQAAPLHQAASIKGGPYSAGPYPASGSATVEQYGFMTVTDSSGTISFGFQGFDAGGVQRVSGTTTFNTTTPGAVSPVTPTNLVAEVVGRDVTISWDVSPDPTFNYFAVRYSTNSTNPATGTWTRINTGGPANNGNFTNPTFTHTNLADGTYSYFVTEINQANGLSSPSEVVTAVVAPAPPPPPVKTALNAILLSDTTEKARSVQDIPADVSEWHMVAVTSDSQVYVDGVLSTGGLAQVFAATGPLVFGSNYYDGINHDLFAGEQFGWALFDRVLPKAELDRIYNSISTTTPPPPPPTLSATYWGINNPMA
jgi:phosphodiesterase/alkaline phosphatase D-like protein